jgi:aspartate racemase
VDHHTQGRLPEKESDAMAIVGIVGGIGPESTVDYYRRLQAAWKQEDPGTAPSIVIDSIDVRRLLALVETDPPALVDYLLASLHRLAGAGVDFGVLASNTPHLVFDQLAERSPVLLLSIVEVCAREAQRRGLRRLGLLGTRFTMEAAFYPDVCARHGIAVVRPSDAERVWVHDTYVGELLRSEFRDETRQEFTALIGRLREEERIDGIILGGTELPLLLRASVIADVPVLDTTALHVTAIIERLRS